MIAVNSRPPLDGGPRRLEPSGCAAPGRGLDPCPSISSPKPPMPVHRLAEMTWTEVRDLGPERSGVVAVLPVGAVEAHGPHLPLATDVIIAEAMARAGAERLGGEGVDGRGLDVLLLPALAYTPAPFARGFPGTLGIGAETLAATLREIGEGLARHGVGILALANAHLDPEHLGALRAAVDTPPAGLAIVVPDLTRRRLAERLTEEFRTGACHAGRYEGSVVLAQRPELVRTEVARDLEPNPSSLSRAIARGDGSFEEAGGPEAYFGWPADATAEEGRATVETLGTILAEAVRETMGGAVAPEDEGVRSRSRSEGPEESAGSEMASREPGEDRA